MAVAATEEPRASAQRKLEDLRRLASRHGVPLELVDCLALQQRKVASLLDVSLRTIESMCAAGELDVVDVRGAPRVLTVSLLEYLETHRRRGRKVARSRAAKSEDQGTAKGRARAFVDARCERGR